jgi:conjugative relaxase-like TrwC/TraI family protein
MAGSVTIGKGHDAAYYTQAARGTDYYSADAQKGGTEPAGIWTGTGCPDLGLEVGRVVKEDVFAQLFDSHVDPRTGERIGRAMARSDAEAIYGRLLDAEPGATAERKSELFIQAQAQAQKARAVPFFDSTFSVSKSITLLHASARASRLAAEDAHDEARAAEAQRIEDIVWRAIRDGAAAGMAHLEEHAGFTRTGAGGVRHEDAHAFVTASWMQHSSRAGDPQLHIHQTILNKVRTESDGRWRTIDGQGLYRERAAAAGISTLVMENALTRDLGVEWVLREDGHGREVKGVPQALMDEFSTRARKDIGPELSARVDAYREEYGHDPDELALWKMGQAVSLEKREPKVQADPVEELRAWSRRARRHAGHALEPLAAQVCRDVELGSVSGSRLSLRQEREIMASALNSLQGKRSTFTRSDLTRAISEQLPASVGVMDPADAAELLPALADRAIVGEAGMVVAALEAPDWLPVPASLRRADGTSVYDAHRATLYATDAQLQIENQILEAAGKRSERVPSAEPGKVAALLGADQASLEAQLVPGTPADVVTTTTSGLHLDQAASAYAMLTSNRRADVLVGPAGTGKSTVIAAISRMWPELHRGGRVIALTETQRGATVLRDMGVSDSHNVSMFLTDPRLRDIPSGSLIVVDEASMVTMPHLSALTGIARRSDAKLILAGDPAQHQAVQAGGGMGMVSRRLGSWQLGEALRFGEDWERTATLRLRAGDETVLRAYDQQGRIMAGSFEDMAEEAYRRWLGDYLNGTDSVLIAHDKADAHEMSRRARADLIRYGKVSDGASVRLREGMEASAGDLIMSRQNDKRISAGYKGRTRSNRDVYVVDNVVERGAVVRLRLGVDKDGGQRYGEQIIIPADYLAEQCHLAYGRTSFDVQGSTFKGNAYALVRPSDDRRYLYTAMSRGATANYAFAVTEERELPTEKWPKAAPEVERARMLEAERSGVNPGADRVASSRDGAGLLAVVLARDDEALSATETLEEAFSDADHLATLSRMWTDLTGREYSTGYGQVLRDKLGDDRVATVTSDYRFTWLCRTLRGAELAGRDGKQMLEGAIERGGLDDAESIAAVLDHRLREDIPAAMPLAGGWKQRAPETADPEVGKLIAAVGEAMDDRTRRLGEHTARTLPLWAERDLGGVPDDPAKRLEWQHRASAIAAYREITGYASPGDPIGPAPSASAPEARASWHTALSALAKVDGIDLRDLSEAELTVRRDTYARETGWAPVHVGRELRLARQARSQAAVRKEASQREAGLAADRAARQRHEANAAEWGKVGERACGAVGHYESAMETREQWERVTEPTRRMALAADLELRRRNPRAQIEPLRSAEPESEVTPGNPDPSDADILTALGLDRPRKPEPEKPPARAPEPGEATRTTSICSPARQELEPEAEREPDFEEQPEPVPDTMDHPKRTAEAARDTQARLDELMSMREPAEDPDAEPSEPWAQAAERQREAVVQKPEERVLVAEKVQEADFEAAE